MYLKPLLVGALTWVPGVPQLLPRRAGTGAESAAYCYSVWLKHLVMLWGNGMRSIPDSMAELGPGDSLGVGIAALLCGVNNYYALDVVRRVDSRTNVRVLHQLFTLLQARAPRPSKGWPDYDGYLDERLFPSHILTDEVLERTLNPDRLRLIRAALTYTERHMTSPIAVRYVVPWTESAITKDTVDVILSHVVLQSVADLESTYSTLYSWLKPGGLMSHQIDYTSFRTARAWNGHRTYSETIWKLIVGGRSFLINRQPHSMHVELMKKCGFEITCELKHYEGAAGIDRSQLAERWKDISDDDLACSGAFVQARKPRSH